MKTLWRRHVAMDHAKGCTIVVAKLVRVVQPLQHVPEDRGCRREVDASLQLMQSVENPIEGLALEVLHRHEVGALELANLKR